MLRNKELTVYRDIIESVLGIYKNKILCDSGNGNKDRNRQIKKGNPVKLK